jgi:hypothetical protein
VAVAEINHSRPQESSRHENSASHPEFIDRKSSTCENLDQTKSQHREGFAAAIVDAKIAGCDQ